MSINFDFFLQSDKEKFKLWKASMKISPEEVLILGVEMIFNLLISLGWPFQEMETGTGKI